MPGRAAGPASGYAAQGNILVSARPSTRSPRRSRRLRDGRSPSGCSTASTPPRRRAATAVAASRPRSSSSSGTAATPALSDTLVDLRVDDHADPLGELRRLYRLHDELFGKTPRDEWITVDDVLRAELDELLARVGHATLADWAGVENLEERVDGEDEIDPVVLARLRESA